MEADCKKHETNGHNIRTVQEVLGLLLILVAKSAAHEIQAFILFAVAVVCMSGAGTIDAVNTLRKEGGRTAPTARSDTSCEGVSSFASNACRRIATPTFTSR
jgi:hypothetical protein